MFVRVQVIECIGAPEWEPLIDEGIFIRDRASLTAEAFRIDICTGLDDPTVIQRNLEAFYWVRRRSQSAKGLCSGPFVRLTM